VRLAHLTQPPNDKEMQKRLIKQKYDEVFSKYLFFYSHTTVYHIGRVFYKQDEAFKYLDSHFDAKVLHVFAFEQVIGCRS